MVAGLLYFIGLVAVLLSIAMAGYSAPGVIETFTTAMDAGQNMVVVVTGLAAGLAWAFYQIVGGLVLMGLGRIIMLLSAINRSLRGQG